MLKAVSMAGIEEQGVPFKKESIALDEAAKTIAIGHLTWIECVVDDIVDETPKILEKLDRIKTNTGRSFKISITRFCLFSNRMFPSFDSIWKFK